MPIALPEPIADYFAAATSDAAACFRDDAVVTDERRTHVGTDAIRAWRTEAAAKYSYTSTPVSADERDGRWSVTAHVAGTFPGSPVDLRYVFTLDGDRIAALEIRP